MHVLKMFIDYYVYHAIRKNLGIMFLMMLSACLPILCKSGPDRTDTLTGAQGFIATNGDLKGGYIENTKHRWIINAPPSTVINIHFLKPIHLESAFLSSDCYDWLSIFDGPTAPDLRCAEDATPTVQYCGRKNPDDYTSSSNTLVIEFCSDYDVQMDGVSLQWTSLQKPPTTAHPTYAPFSCGVPSPVYHQDIPISSNGSVLSGLMSKIVGGSHAPAHSWPWAVALFTKSSWHGKYQFCGGTLISPNWVLTAAHCFVGVTDLSIYWVKLGADVNKAATGDPTLPNESTQQVCTILTKFEHPEYNHGTHSHDMTLLKLNCNVKFTDAVKPACLPTAADNRPFNGEEIVTVGWGTTSCMVVGGQPSTYLREVIVQDISNQECNTEYDHRIDDTMFCCETANKDSCQGDSGGGAFSYNQGKWEVTGIVSWGDGCARRGYAGVYSRVTSMIGWLEQTMNTN